MGGDVSGVAKGRQVGERAPGRRLWGSNGTLFAIGKKRVLSRNLYQRMLKSAYFFRKKTVKIASASEAPPPHPSLPPAEPQTPELFLLPIITTLSSSFQVLNASERTK